MADTEDLSKLTACGLVLLGQIFLHMGRTQEVPGMVTSALQLAQKIPEVNIQLWGTALLRGTDFLSGNLQSYERSLDFCSVIYLELSTSWQLMISSLCAIVCHRSLQSLRQL